MKKIAECLLYSPKASENLKKAIKENTDDNVMKAIHNSRAHLDKNDGDAIRECRKQSIETIYEKYIEIGNSKSQEKKQQQNEA